MVTRNCLILVCGLLTLTHYHANAGDDPGLMAIGGTSIAFSPDGELLAIGASDGRIRLLDGRTGAIDATLTGHDDYVSSVAFAPDGASLASGSEDGTIRLWDVRRRVERAVFRVPQECEGSARFFRRTYTRSHSALHNPRRAETLVPAGRRVGAIAYAPDGKTLAATYDSGEVRLWDVGTGTHKASWQAHQRKIFALRYAPDGREIATGADGEFCTWDVETHQRRLDIKPKYGYPSLLAYAPDGKHLAVCTGKDISIRDTVSGEETLLIPFEEKNRLVYCVEYDPSGSCIYIGGYFGIQYSRVDQHPALQDLVHRSMTFGDDTSLSISPDGKRLAYCVVRWLPFRTAPYQVVDIR